MFFCDAFLFVLSKQQQQQQYFSWFIGVGFISFYVAFRFVFSFIFVVWFFVPLFGEAFIPFSFSPETKSKCERNKVKTKAISI